MTTRSLTICLLGLGLSGLASAQARKATLMGGAAPDRGRCVVEVTVDSAAEVEVRGDTGTLRNLAGQSPAWRKLECNSGIPFNAQNFRFTGLGGRGSQELVRGPQNGGTAIVRIQDNAGGADTYRFEVSWGPREVSVIPPPPPNRGRFTTEQAIGICQEAVRQQAFERFRAQNVAFRRTAIDDKPGRQDWVTGILDVRRGFDRDEAFSFSCSVNFDNGQVRSAQLDPLVRDRMPDYDKARPSGARVAMESCQRSVEDNIGQRGYQHIDIVSIRVDDRPGRSDWIMGDARADMRRQSDSFTFSCSVDLRNGDIRSIDVRQRR